MKAPPTALRNPTRWGARGRRTPAGLAPLVWLESRPGRLWQERDGSQATPAAANADPVGDLAELAAAGLQWLAPADDQRPTLQTSPRRRVYDGVNDRLTRTAPVVAAGEFALYATGAGLSSFSIWVPLGRVGSGESFLVNQTHVWAIGPVTAIYADITAISGLRLCRWRRTAAGAVYFATSGQPEVLIGTNTDTFTLDTEGSRVATAQYSAGDHYTTLLVPSDTVAAGSDAQVQAYLRALDGVAPV